MAVLLLSRSAGVIVGLAIHNGHTLNLNLAPVMFRKLLRAPLRLEDLSDVHPEIHRSLRWLLQYPAERVEEDMGLTFQVRAFLLTDGSYSQLSLQKRFYDCYTHAVLCQLTVRGCHVPARFPQLRD
jgi:hypothetical protein